MLPALLDGRIDAFTNGDPWVSLAMDSGKVRFLAKSLDSIAPRFLFTAWFSTTGYIENNRAVAEQFERVLHQAAIDANAHRSEMVPIVASYTKLDPAMIARTLKEFDASYLDTKEIQPMIDASVKYHVVEKGFDAADFISPSALHSK
jgi:ABC-type nitrate/sulfonate/bicarbonate transport system substrate-binding protein